MKTIATRLGKKRAVIETDKKKIENLEHQIALYTNSIEKTREQMSTRESEVEYLTTLQTEAVELSKQEAELRRYTEGLMAKYSAFDWSPDMPWEQKIESSDYSEKQAERFRIIARLEEIEKLANKAYFRR